MAQCNGTRPPTKAGGLSPSSCLSLTRIQFYQEDVVRRRTTLFYQSRSREDVSQELWEQAEGIHEGTFAPWYLRCLWSIVGLTPLLLAFTGAATWWHRRRRRTRNRGRG